MHADGILIPVLRPGNGKTSTARLWTYVCDNRPRGDSTRPSLWFAQMPDRKGIHPQAHGEDDCVGLGDVINFILERFQLDVTLITSDLCLNHCVEILHPVPRMNFRRTSWSTSFSTIDRKVYTM